MKAQSTFQNMLIKLKVQNLSGRKNAVYDFLWMPFYNLITENIPKNVN